MVIRTLKTGHNTAWPIMSLKSRQLRNPCLLLLRWASNWILPFKLTLHCWQLNVWRLASKEWAEVTQGRGWWPNTLVFTTFSHGVWWFNWFLSKFSIHSLFNLFTMVKFVWNHEMLYAYIHNFLVILTLMTVYKTVSHHNGPFSTASKHKNEKVSIYMC